MCDFISATKRWGLTLFCPLQGCFEQWLISVWSMFSYCEGGGWEAEAGWNWWVKYVLKKNEYCYLPLVKLWIKLAFFWSFQLQRNIFMSYVHVMYLSMPTYIYENFQLAESLIPFPPRHALHSALSIDANSAHVLRWSNSWWPEECAAVCQDPLEAPLGRAYHLQLHCSSHDAAKIREGQQGCSWGKDWWLTQAPAAGVGKSEKTKGSIRERILNQQRPICMSVLPGLQPNTDRAANRFPVCCQP